jgi:AAA family ATP:ADP antiporter
MMGLFFLVVCAVGILRPIKNALALDGLGATDFYKTYLVSAGVILFVPVFTHLSKVVAWRWLIPMVAATFAIELVLFRIFYVPGSAAFGLMFYGWYDLFAAALVAQFFMATQLFFNARSAKQAYPLVIAGGSIGATLGGAITGFTAERVGTPNLLLVAAFLIVVFSVAMPLVWGHQESPERPRNRPHDAPVGSLRTLFSYRQIRLIAIGVLLTVLVKQLIDYQFNAMTKEVFQDRDAISSFQGKFNAVTQWLPIVALALIQPAMKRWGVGVAVLLLPAAMLLVNIGLEIWWGLGAAVVAKGAETSLRYSSERAGREILYVPVPEEIKLKAKAYIDVGLEKGLGKVASVGLIAVAQPLFGYRQLTLVGIVLCSLWLVAALAMRHEYVRTLARSIEGRFASLRGSFASIAEASTRTAVRRALNSGDPQQIAFALDLASQAAANDVKEIAPDLNQLLDHPTEGIRQRTLQLLARSPTIDAARVRARLLDDAPAVREAAAEALCTHGDPQEVLGELLHSSDAGVRTAALSCVVRGVVSADIARWITRDYIEEHLAAVRAGDRAARWEVALAAGVLTGEAEAVRLTAELAADPDPDIASAALHSAGRLRASELYPVMLQGLARANTRAAARAALTNQNPAVAAQLAASLVDQRTPDRVRRQIPAVLGHIPAEDSVRALLRSYLAPETDQVLDFRALKAMSKLRARAPGLSFDRQEVTTALRREADAAAKYESARAAVAALEADLPGVQLLCRTLDEAWTERRESAFRLLGLLFPPDAMRDCHQTLCTANVKGQANAIEWLEHTIGHDLFAIMTPFLREGAGGNGRSPTAAQALHDLTDDNDAWVSHLARWAAHDLGLPGAQALRAAEENGMDLVEKVFLLQQVDLLQGARSAQLALLASIANVQDIPANTTLIRQNEPTSALYVVIRGAVELRTTGNQVMEARDNAAFGTWALIDQAPSMLTAHTIEPTRVLCIDRDDFHDLLNENPELALGLLQGLARRVRTLVA